mgnify:CR=1 FL=1
MEINIGDMCTHCGRDTAFGAVDEAGDRLLLFVNRIPSGADGTLILAGGDDVAVDVTIEGYMCAECQAIDCDRCGIPSPEYQILELVESEGTEIVCADCLGISRDDIDDDRDIPVDQICNEDIEYQGSED